MESLKGFECCLKNSKDHLKAAEIISKDVSYGIAYSHIVLSCEEAVKAMMCLGGWDWKVGKLKPELKKYFGGPGTHGRKLDAAKGFSFIFTLNDFHSKLFETLQRESEKGNGDYMEAFKKNINKAFAETEKNWKEINDGHDLNSEFWKDANKSKQHGLYVDFSETEGWHLPEEITKMKFENDFQFVAKFISNVEGQRPTFYFQGSGRKND